MQLLIRSLFRLIFPPSRDELTVEASSPRSFEKKLQLSDLGNGLYSLSSFKDTQVRAALHLSKYHHHTNAHALLSALLACWLSKEMDELLIIPIPLSSSRRRRRGHNQVETVAALAIKQCKRHALAANVLYRSRDTAPQTTLGKKEREENLAGAFSVSKNGAHLLQDKHVIILDDVLTTGATLRNAKKALQSCKTRSVRCVAIAH